MNLAETATLPPTLTTDQAAELLGITADHLWKLRREGQAPVESLQLGRALRWPTVPLLELLGISRDETGPLQAGPVLTAVPDPDVIEGVSRG